MDIWGKRRLAYEDKWREGYYSLIYFEAPLKRQGVRPGAQDQRRVLRHLIIRLEHQEPRPILKGRRHENVE